MEWQKKKVDPYIPTNTFNACCIPENILRVAVMPIAHNNCYLHHVEELNSVFNKELNKKKLFEVVPVESLALEKIYLKSYFNSTEELPLDLFTRIKQKTAAQAILFIDLTQYSPYCPITIGIRMKLVDIDSQSIIWSFDEIFDASKPIIGQSAYQYAKRDAKYLYPIGSEEIIFQSPQLFSQYVAHSVFLTLNKPL